MSADEPQLDTVNESYDDGALAEMELHVESAFGLQVTAVGTDVDGQLRLAKITPAEGRRTWSREGFASLRFALDELRDRGFDVDIGPLANLGGRADATDSTSDSQPAAATTDGGVQAASGSTTPDSQTPRPSPRALGDELAPAIRRLDTDESADEDTETDDGDDPEVWCGICGEGPFKSLSHHHRRVHDGDPVPLDSEPNAPLEADLPAWLPQHPDQTLANASGAFRRSLEEILDEVERQDTLLDVHQRLGSGYLNRTKQVLGDLGLLAPNGEELETNATLEERIPIIREVVEE